MQPDSNFTTGESNTACILLGSNMGNSFHQLETAAAQLAQKTGTIIQQSGIYVTAAWGFTQQPDFLNQVIVLHTKLCARQTLESMLTIEAEMGRVRTVKNAPRVIDIDLLFFNADIIAEPDLTVPHPRIQDRRFVLVPLDEILPNFLHPVFKENIHQLLTKCPDQLNVKKY